MIYFVYFYVDSDGRWLSPLLKELERASSFANQPRDLLAMLDIRRVRRGELVDIDMDSCVFGVGQANILRPE